MSKIEWTNAVWNPTTGCEEISKECKFCYAELMTKRLKAMGKPKYQQGFDVFVEHEDALTEPYKWRKPRTIFVNSMSDLFHKDATLEFLKRTFTVMNETPKHTYQVLTKRHHELEEHSDQLIWTDNIWMGVSVGSQIAVRRIEKLVECGAKNKFLSIEPLIEELPELNLTGIDWAIVGGESGKVKGIRPMKKEWVLNVKKSCEKYDIRFFFKQWGAKRNNPDPNDPTLNKDHRYYAKGGCMLNNKLYQANPTIEDDSVPVINVFGNEYYVMDELEELRSIWELKSHLPLLKKKQYMELKKDIKENGLSNPIPYYVTNEGTKLVVGYHNEVKACIQLKIKNIPTIEIKENFESLDEIKNWMSRGASILEIE